MDRQIVQGGAEGSISVTCVVPVPRIAWRKRCERKLVRQTAGTETLVNAMKRYDAREISAETEADILVSSLFSSSSFDT